MNWKVITAMIALLAAYVAGVATAQFQRTDSFRGILINYSEKSENMVVCGQSYFRKGIYLCERKETWD